MPCETSSRAMSAWMSEKPIAKSGPSFRISPIFALVNAETFGFSLRARAGRVEHFGGFFGEADDAARAVHDTIESMPDHRHRQLALVRRGAVFPQVNALPGTQRR